MTKIYVAGDTGLVGSAIVRELVRQGVAVTDIVTRTHSELDLTDQQQVREFFRTNQIDQVYFAAARVGGVLANDTYPAEFIADNLLMTTNVIRTAHESNVNRLVFVGSTCIYPRTTPQPVPESALLTGRLEATNEPYAVAKIAGVKLCESYHRQYNRDYRTVLPCNLYGPGDNYDPENGHVTAGMIDRFHRARVANSSQVTVWGTGTPRREFLYVDDMARGVVHVATIDRILWESATLPRERYVNLGTGQDITIREMALTVADVVGYTGLIEFDHTRPDGTLLKCTDTTRIRSLGWQPQTSLRDGLEQTYQAYLQTL